MTKGNVSEHIDPVQEAINWYKISTASQIVNMDQSGMSFCKMVGRSLRKGFCSSKEKKDLLGFQKTLTTKGNRDRVTLMPVVDAAGFAYKL